MAMEPSESPDPGVEERRLGSEGVKLPPAVQSVIESARRLVFTRASIEAIALVGSWARGAGRADSDVDLIVLTTDRPALLDSDDWYRVFDPHAALVGKGCFGAITERRLHLPSGLEVEVGVGSPEWATTNPVDAGTLRVVADGMEPVYDPRALLANLTGFVAVPRTGSS